MHIVTASTFNFDKYENKFHQYFMRIDLLIFLISKLDANGNKLIILCGNLMFNVIVK